MPEEVNRIVADHLSDLCLCPTTSAMQTLRAEGIGERGRLVGDVMLDACLAVRDRTDDAPLRRFEVKEGGYSFVTIHRAENTDDASRLRGILAGLGRLPEPVVLPLHPRTRAAIADAGASLPENVRITEPLSYGEAVSLLARACRVITDSGGLQKEAYFLAVPCLTVRGETEWPETVASGWNRLVSADPESVCNAAAEATRPGEAPELDLFGGGRACERIVGEIDRYLDGA
jgi:UDP-GlcNAc3NAcA epimerase